jgi:hypothetical protein
LSGSLRRYTAGELGKELLVDLLAAGKALTCKPRIYPTEQGSMEDKCEFSTLPSMESKKTRRPAGVTFKYWEVDSLC